MAMRQECGGRWCVVVRFPTDTPKPTARVTVHQDTSMACERCGCRMVTRARGGQGDLICTDCGHRADPTLHGERMRKAWFGVIALFGIALLGVLILTLAMLQESRERGSAPLDSERKDLSE